MAGVAKAAAGHGLVECRAVARDHDVLQPAARTAVAEEPEAVQVFGLFGGVAREGVAQREEKHEERHQALVAVDQQRLADAQVDAEFARYERAEEIGRRIGGKCRREHPLDGVFRVTV